MTIWQDEMESIKRVKSTIYRPPLPKKKQRVFCPEEQPGPIKVYSKEEIREYESRTSSS